MEVGEARRLFDVVLADVVAQEADVVGDGAGDEVGVLRHERDLPCPFGSREHADVSPVREHQAARGLAKPEQQLDEGGLAAAGRADDTDDLVRVDGGAHVAEDRCVGGVFERDVIQAERADRADRLAVIDDLGASGIESSSSSSEPRNGRVALIVVIDDLQSPGRSSATAA